MIKKILPFILLLGLTWLAFGNALQNNFVRFDDDQYLVNNPYMRGDFSKDDIQWALKADLLFRSAFTDYWQPITHFSHMIDVHFFGMNAKAHHATNLLLHFLNVLLLFTFLHRLTRKMGLSLIASVLFAVHPVHAETIAWVTARKDLIAFFWILICFHVYISKNLFLSAKKLLCWLLYALALMSKPSAIVLPLLLMVWDYWKDGEAGALPFKQFFQISLRDKLPLFVLTLLYLPVPFLGQSQAFEFSFSHHLLQGILAYPFYLLKIFFPFSLGLYGPTPLEWPPVILPLLALCLWALTGFFLYRYQKKQRQITACLAFFIVSLLPVLFLPWPADRFLYLPSIGILFLLALAIDTFISDSAGRKVLTAFLVILFVMKSSSQVTVWGNSQSLFQNALRINARNYAALTNLGALLMQEDRLEEAQVHLTAALILKPKNAETHNNLGVFFMKKYQYEDAEKHFQAALSINPSFPDAYYNLGAALYFLGKKDQAMSAYQKTISINPRHASAYNGIGSILAQEGEYQKAYYFFAQALTINPRHQDATKNIRAAEEHLSAINQDVAVVQT